MPLQQPQTQARRATRPVAEAMTIATSTPSANEIPFDYVAKFNLRGQRGNRVQDVINISVEGAFVAVAIAYSFIPAPQSPLPQIPFGSIDGVGAERPSPTLTQLIAERLVTALNVPDILNRQQTVNQLTTVMQPFIEPRELMQCLQLKLCGIHFKYSIVDSGSGRELQNQPIHNISGLGESSGDRPFRPFAKPMIFLPRSTIRIEVEEISEGPIFGYDDPTTGQRIGAELYIVLHGYKMLGYGSALP